MSNEAKLGTVPKADDLRDAVHIAIIPACAAEFLEGGSPVKLNTENKAQACSPEEAIGIVDPFIQSQCDVEEGEWFWLCLYPKTITGLRHDWEHPSFPETTPFPQTTKEANVMSDEKLFSKKWLEGYVRTHCPYWRSKPDGGYSEFLRHVDRRTIFYYGSGCHSLDEVADADELFDHLSIVLGRRINAEYFEEFGCSC